MMMMMMMMMIRVWAQGQLEEAAPLPDSVKSYRRS
jgi:hypothetical protein